jgi:transcriptional regulator with XRE-family HTH domain
MSAKNPHKRLGRRLKRILDMQTDLQKNIATKAGCQPTEISRWVRGEVAPTYNKLAGIARACKLSDQELGWLLDGKGKAPDYPGYKEDDDEPDENQEEDKVRELIHAKEEMISSLKENIALLKWKVLMLEKELHSPKKPSLRAI